METFVLFCVTLLVDGVFGYTDEVKSVSVMEGDSVTLFTDLTEIQKADLILWAFGSDSTRIVQINRMANKISLYEDVLDGRFRDRLKVDHQTGSLIITNITTQHTGLYRFLQIIDRKEVLPKKFSIIVSARLSVPVISSNHSQCSSSSSSSYCSLLCSVVNVGHVTLSWYKGNSLLSSISVSDLSISLSLPLEVEYQDKNTYSCVLNNPISNQTRHLDISKLCQPCSAPGLSAVHIALVCVCALAVAAVLCGIYYYCQRKTRKQADKGDELDGEELKNIKSVVPGNNGDMHQPNHDGETSNEGRHLKNDAVPLLAVEVDGGNASVQEGDLETRPNEKRADPKPSTEETNLPKPEQMTLKFCFIYVFVLLTGSASLHQVVESTEGSSVILKCSHRSIELEEKHLTVHWRHNDTRNIFNIINGKVSVKEQDPAYKSRAEVSPEELKKGRVFLKLTDLQLSDGGTYVCFVPALGIDHSTQLVIKERSFITCTTAEIRNHVEGIKGSSVLLKCSQKSIELEEKQLTVHWRHNDIRNVFDIIHGNVSIKEQDSAYKNRAEVLPEELKKGRVFLKLNDLQLSDGGTYLCFVPALGIDHSTQLVVKERSFITCTAAQKPSHRVGYNMYRRCCFICVLTLLIDAASLHQVVESTEGSSVLLKCSHRRIVLEEKQQTVHWRHNDIRNVFDIIRGKVSTKEQDPAYKNRAEVLREELKGHVFLRLTDLQLSDGGTYLCFVPALGIDHSTQLVVKERPLIKYIAAQVSSHASMGINAVKSHMHGASHKAAVGCREQSQLSIASFCAPTATPLPNSNTTAELVRHMSGV
ncbi:hypothetical protein G5714_021315 [Onychostoma macrolepis]|uniref:Ig-like domain-containing protein n=1 Tax=Onychostoma macrolepis TaxID=369639 RepID=A0A7J6BQN4_9TELE|nr:hypothetical protein G5714_021315 [Onychostoma macrolepis]